MSSITRKKTQPDPDHKSESGCVEKRCTMDEYYEWAHRGICVRPNVNKNLWISSKPTEKERAKIFCEICKVREVCLSYALANQEEAGIWGGLDFNKSIDLGEIDLLAS